VIHFPEDHGPEIRERIKIRLQKGVAFTVARYGLAVVGNAFVTQLTLRFAFMREMPFVLFFAVAMISTLYGGIGPGFLAIALSASIVAFALMPPYFRIPVNADPEHALQIALYVLVSAMSCAFLAGWERKVLHFQEEEAKYRNLTESTPEGVLLMDDHERIIYVNDMGRRLFGEPQESLIGKQLEAIVPREIYGPAWEELRHRLDSRKEVEPVRFVRECAKQGAVCLELTLRTFSQKGHALFAAWLHPVRAARRDPFLK
jgi:PAS domain S-box-containing protein